MEIRRSGAGFRPRSAENRRRCSGRKNVPRLRGRARQDFLAVDRPEAMNGASAPLRRNPKTRRREKISRGYNGLRSRVRILTAFLDRPGLAAKNSRPGRPFNGSRRGTLKHLRSAGFFRAGFPSKHREKPNPDDVRSGRHNLRASAPLRGRVRQDLSTADPGEPMNGASAPLRGICEEATNAPLRGRAPALREAESRGFGLGFCPAPPKTEDAVAGERMFRGSGDVRARTFWRWIDLRR